MTSREATSSWNSAPSIATWRMRGFTTLIRLSAWTTSGQFWHDKEKYVSNTKSPSSARTCSSSSGEAFGG